MKKYIFVTLLLFLALGLNAQQKNKVAEQYIKKYSHIAVANMREFGIPASVTMAQGLLESGNGQSELAKKSNNHFGIKCKKEWKGDKVYHDDDEEQECFRKYDSVEDSYADHAIFLSNSSRYASLFMLPKGDYKGWAHGLKKAGYATNPKYSIVLIDLIERYELHALDNAGVIVPRTNKHIDKHINIKTTPSNSGMAAYILGGRSVYRDRKELFVYAQKSDSYEKIGKALKIRPKKLERFNGGERALVVGEKIFISKKRNK